ncbi:AVAST type 1 anti-phage system MBL fold metallo-hydrolase Avs1a [Lysinibacillus irui]|uniref:AVAST type 1 anti-phage system MBL fold metallo-hydrolase Avs1a n=1 Tax=Lysinibacillus irui TaxID=2998077 RepID=A0ABU5NKS0_9BACI|nr:AVAST type 1 anti-phage system MBL fold metallo-hydrolase Avs1a [Lysinibacillus irui]MEA0554874.1 AVAST type 1 anti-phage system MBL fold metallo-hydrolase Avs1a [Lysinibacillus irui]MEA0976589.1 AVAST type 1 anti-phage system MBL fold metallo-hydrolase Avs1a [Lysinibacillus irui]MEA1042743.1 AVAST type 1 anti-phage system MBL fold metallo-hydrolase Avs1a [Lysinibacillus irui]
MVIKMNMLPAKYGDCFLIEIKYEESKVFNILIDAGLSLTYKNYLKPKLSEMALNGQRIDLFIITHIDADHIAGAIPFIKENGIADTPKIISINEIWHNAYRHLHTNIPTESNNNLNKMDVALIKSIEVNGYPEENENEFIEEEVQVNISARQGSTLAALLKSNNYNWNSSFDGKAINYENKKSVSYDDVKIVILSPNTEKLEKLKMFWKTELVAQGYIGDIMESEDFDDAFEFLLSREKVDFQENPIEISSQVKDVENLILENFIEDTSATNGSSISFVIEFKDKKVLYLADSHPGIIYEKLTEIYGDEKKIIFDAIKISHHGSKSNTSLELLDIVDSPYYFISANGKHGHPDLVTIARIISRPTAFSRNIIFNYKTDASKFFNNDSLKDKFNYNIKILEDMDSVIL